MKDKYIKIIAKTNHGGMIPEKNYYVTEETAKIIVNSKRAIYFDAELNIQDETETDSSEDDTETETIETETETEQAIDTQEETQEEKTIEESDEEDVVDNTDSEKPAKRTYNKRKKK